MATKLKDFSYKWIEEKKKNVKYSTYCAYLTILENKINPFFAENELSSESIILFISSLEKEGLCNKSVKDIMTVLKMIVKYMVKENVISKDQVTFDEKVKETRKNIDVLSNGDYKRLYHYLYNNFNFLNLGIIIAMSTGLRIGEICALKWKDIDIEMGEIIVSKTLQRVYNKNEERTEIVIDSPKTFESNRKVPITSNLLKLIKPLMKIVNIDFYVLSNSMKPIEPRTFREHFHRVLSCLQIRHVKFHCLRHTFATRCVDAGCDYKALSSILGHSNISTTLDLYVHPTNEQKRKCVEKMIKKI